MFSDPVAYFITFTCYGTWLPGDDRGWTRWHKGDKVSQPLLADWCREQMAESPVLLDQAQREIVEQTIGEHCQHRSWRLHAVNCRSNHCHVVVTAGSHDGEEVRNQLKAWCVRKLKDEWIARGNSHDNVREHWWTAKGSVRLLFDTESVHAAIAYTLEAQDSGGSKNESM